MTAKAPWIAIAACVLLAAGFYFLAWKPADDEQVAFEQETAELDRQATSLRNEIVTLTDIKANAADYRTALATLGDYVPEGPAQPTVVAQLQQAADDAGMTIASLQFAEPQPVEGAPDSGEPGMVLASIATSVQLDGEYFQIVDFLRRLEVDLPRAMLGQGLQLSEGDEGLPQLTGTWTGDLFALVPVADAEAGDTDADPGEGADADAGGDAADDPDEDADPDGGDDPDDVDLDDDELQEASG